MTYKMPHEEAKPPKLNPGKIPKDCYQYISLAEKFGIADEGYRIDLLDSLGENEKEELRSFIRSCPSSLNNWLCGKDSESKEPSDEYITFTALVMAADYVGK